MLESVEKSKESDCCHESAAIATANNFNHDIYDIQLSEHNITTAVFLVQHFIDITNKIRDEFLVIESLVIKVTQRYCPDSKKAKLQHQLAGMINNVNNIVNDTVYAGNKLFTTDGQVMFFYIGQEQNIALYPKNLSLNTEELDLTKNTGKAMDFITNKTKQADEYIEYLNHQAKLLVSIMLNIDYRIAATEGVKLKNFSVLTAKKLNKIISWEIVKNQQTSAAAQWNILSDTAVHLLK